MKISKKILFTIITVLILIILLVVCFAYIDLNKIRNGNKPIFSFYKETYKDGGSILYQGLGYKIIKFARPSTNGNIAELGFIFSNIYKYNNNQGVKIAFSTFNGIITDINNNSITISSITNNSSDFYFDKAILTIDNNIIYLNNDGNKTELSSSTISNLSDNNEIYNITDYYKIGQSVTVSYCNISKYYEVENNTLKSNNYIISYINTF